MKNLYTCLIALLLPCALYSQKIHFTDTANVWIRDCVQDFSPQIHYTSSWQYTGDTVYNGQAYHKADDIPGKVLVREDTTAGKVYVRFFQGDTAERVLYNYNLHLGDTMSTMVYNPQTAAPQQIQSIVYQYDSLLLNNTWHKHWYFHRINGLSFQIIEGVGCIESDPFFPLRLNVVEYWCQLCALQQNGNYIYGSYTACHPVGIEAVTHQAPPQFIIPSPCTANDRIRFPEVAPGAEFCIYNNQGQKMTDIVLPAPYLEPGQYLYAPGLYFYVLNSGGNKITTGRFVYTP